MKKFSVFLCSIMLVFGMAATVSAVPVEFTFTGDNYITSWFVDGSEKVGLLSDLNDWRYPDIVTLNLDEGSHQIIWNVEDKNDDQYIAGFLGQLAADGGILTSSDAWDIRYEDSGWMPATQIAANGYGPWGYKGPLTDIDLSAFWIWADYVPKELDGYVANADIRVRFTVGSQPTLDNPVPEPATMLLLGTGLIGLAGLGRKRFLKK